MTLKEWKEKQKVLAEEIRTLKKQRKEYPNGSVPGLDYRRGEYRYNHIAYCMARGRKYEEIERTCREEPYMPRVQRLIALIELPEPKAPEMEVANG